MKSLPDRIAVSSFFFLLVAFACLPQGAIAQPQAMMARPGQLPPIDAAFRSAIVDSVTAAIDSVYVIAEGAERIVHVLRQKLAEGAYDELTDPAEFARKLEEDAQATHHDGHFGIRAMLPAPPAPEESTEDPDDDARRQRYMRERNFGFKKVELLPGNIGYLKLDMFAHGEEAARTAVAAMNFLANAGALVIDLRENGGGSASMIRMLATYLFEDRVHLINWYVRAEEKTEQSRTMDFVPGRRLTDVPVYVLTSSSTFSAAEEFTFDLKHLERATVVGDTTGGGGHTVADVSFDFADFRIGMRLPYGRAFDPKTGEGWEGVGVIPDIAVPSEQALQVAHREALKARVAVEEEPDARFVMEWALEDLDSRVSPLTLTEKQLKKFVGTFGPRRIFMEGGVLYYQREDRPRFQLEPMAEDLFRVGDLEYFRLKFGRDDRGKVIKVIGLYDNGRQDQNERSEG